MAWKFESRQMTPFTQVSYSYDDRLILISSPERDVVLDAKTGQTKLSITVKYSRRPEANAAFAHHSNLLATSIDNGKVRLMNAENGLVIKEFQTSIKEGIVSFAFSPEDNLLLVGTDCCNDSLEVWDIEQSKQVQRFLLNILMRPTWLDGENILGNVESHPAKFNWKTKLMESFAVDEEIDFSGDIFPSPDQKFFAFSSIGESLQTRILDVKTNKVVARFDNSRPLTTSSVATAFSNQNCGFFAVVNHSFIDLYRTSDWSLVRKIATDHVLNAINFSADCESLGMAFDSGAEVIKL